MLLLIQTYNGLKMSFYSHIEAIQFLLAEGFQYVLSERFMRDVIEDYRGPGTDNLIAQQFGYNNIP